MVVMMMVIITMMMLMGSAAFSAQGLTPAQRREFVGVVDHLPEAGAQ